MLKRAVNFQGFSKLTNATAVWLVELAIMHKFNDSQIQRKARKNSMFALSDLVFVICLS